MLIRPPDEFEEAFIKCCCLFFRLAVDMDIHGYIHVWISDLSHAVDISMDI